MVPEASSVCSMAWLTPWTWRDRARFAAAVPGPGSCAHALSHRASSNPPERPDPSLCVLRARNPDLRAYSVATVLRCSRFFSRTCALAPGMGTPRKCHGGGVPTRSTGRIPAPNSYVSPISLWRSVVRCLECFAPIKSQPVRIVPLPANRLLMRPRPSGEAGRPTVGIGSLATDEGPVLAGLSPPMSNEPALECTAANRALGASPPLRPGRCSQLTARSTRGRPGPFGVLGARRQAR